MYNCPRCVDRFQPVVAKKEKNEIAKLLSWFLMLSKIMAQPYDDTFTIISKEHKNYKLTTTPRCIYVQQQDIQT